MRRPSKYIMGKAHYHVRDEIILYTEIFHLESLTADLPSVPEDTFCLAVFDTQGEPVPDTGEVWLKSFSGARTERIYSTVIKDIKLRYGSRLILSIEPVALVSSNEGTQLLFLAIIAHTDSNYSQISEQQYRIIREFCRDRITAKIHFRRMRRMH